MSDMIERVARVLEDLPLWAGPYEIAKAAIQAMREPTNSMLECAGSMEGFDGYELLTELDKCHIDWWQAMIDAALNEGSNEIIYDGSDEDELARRDEELNKDRPHRTAWDLDRFFGGSMGCVCPPTSEQTCQSPLCPRKAVPLPSSEIARTQ